MNVITITIREYCDLSGYQVRNATQHISNGTLLPYMRGIRKSGSTWLVDVSVEWYESKTEKVCGSASMVEYPAMGMNCENCHPVKVGKV